MKHALYIIDEIAAIHRDDLGDHFLRYQNHACRVYLLCELLHSGTLPKQKATSLAIAAAYCDLPTWVKSGTQMTDNAVLPLMEYLDRKEMLDAYDEIINIIRNRRNQTNHANQLSHWALTFSKAYWIDLSHATRKYGIAEFQYQRLLKQYPSRGFHWLAIAKTLRLEWTDARIHPAHVRG
jgi:hypothetical protein